MGVDVERELRDAMAEHTTGVAASASMADEVRRRHRRHRKRRRGLGAAALVAVVALGAPVYRAVVPDASTGRVATPPSVTATSRTAVIDGVAVTYLPPGLTGRGDRWVGGCTWTNSSQQWVTVEVLRSGGPWNLRTLREENWMPSPHETVVNGRPALRSERSTADGGGREVIWAQRPDLALQVIVGEKYSGQLMKIAEGLRPGAEGTWHGCEVPLPAPASGATSGPR